MENLIREKLAHNEMIKVTNYMRSHPGFNQEFRNQLHEQEISVIKLMSVLDQLKSCHDIFDSIAPLLELAFSNEMIINQSRARYNFNSDSANAFFSAYYGKTFDEYVDGMDEQLESHLDDKEKEDFLDFRCTIGDFISYTRARDDIVDLVVKTASEKGIDYAVSDESLHGSIRQVFPMKEEYLQYLEEEKNLCCKIIHMPIILSLSVLSGLHEKMEEIITPVIDTIHSYREFVSDYVHKQALEEAEEIYSP